MRSLATFALAAGAAAQFSVPQVNNTKGGTGPYSSYYFEDATLANHTIYQPKDPFKVGTKIPVIAWGNGGCMQNGTLFSPALEQIASFGTMIIAVGTIQGIPSTGNGSGPMGSWPERQRAAIDWVVANAGKGNYTHVDATRIAVWGSSCGGIESYANANDTRVNSVGIFNSGLMAETDRTNIVEKITKPIFYFIGGSTDIAYAYAERDYAALPAGTPSWKGNDDQGHLGGFANFPNAGYFGVAGVKYMQWLLRGDAAAGAWFTDGSALRAGFKDQTMKNLESIKVTPIG